MSALFAEDAEGNVVTAADRPSREVVSLLEGFGYRSEVVKRWSAVKANTVLSARQKEQAIALRRAASVAGAQEGETPRGQPTGVERLEAAAALERAAKDGPDELSQAVAYCSYALTDDEAKRVAGYLVKLFRGES